MRHKLLFIHRFIPFGIKSIVPILHNANDADLYTVQTNGKLQGKVALITGGYRGIGLSIAKTFLREGCKVIITGRNEKKLLEVCSSFHSKNIKSIVWDIANLEICEDNFKEALPVFGRLDILVNNAGVTTDRLHRLAFEEITDEHLHYVHDINVIGTRVMCLTFFKLFSSGSILNIISNTSTRAALDAYFTSKWAIRSFTVDFSEKCKGTGFTVNGICPGPIRTDMTPVITMIRANISNRRIGLPEEIGEVASQLVYSSMRGVNGRIVECDGGQNLF